jgi:hypothetical protein
MKRLVFAAALCVALTSPASAWNDRGHMIVAAKAWERLNPQTKRAVNVLLRHNPRYNSWVAGLPAASRARAAFIRAATWPDYIKSAPGYYQDRLPNTKSSRNIGYVDCYQHRYWHYKDLPFSPDGTAVLAPPAPNAETQINLFIQALSDSATPTDVRSYDLAWLLHLIGDVHQPLHATQRFISTDVNGDGGGNDVKYCLTTQCSNGSSLHSFWDGAFGNAEDLRSIIDFARHMPLAPAAQASQLDPAVWLEESFEIAKTRVYQPPIANTLGPVVLTAAYRNDAAATATQRASLAGARLANLLNAMNLDVQPGAQTAHVCPNNDD